MWDEAAGGWGRWWDEAAATCAARVPLSGPWPSSTPHTIVLPPGRETKCASWLRLEGLVPEPPICERLE